MIIYYYDKGQAKGQLLSLAVKGRNVYDLLYLFNVTIECPTRLYSWVPGYEHKRALL